MFLSKAKDFKNLFIYVDFPVPVGPINKNG